MDRKQLLVAVVGLAGLLAALLFLVQVAPSEAPTIEQVLARDDVAEIERIRGVFGSEPDVVLVAIRRADGRVPGKRLQRIEEALAGIDGVAHTWSSLTRPIPVLEPDGTMSVKTATDVADRERSSPLLEPDPFTSVIVVALAPGAVRLTRARVLTAAIDGALARVAEPGETVHVVGTPQLRVASWAVAEEDLARMWPLLVAILVVVPLVFLAAPGAVLFPLVMAALTTTACLLGYRWLSGPLNALALLLVPIVWSVATLDAMHLYARVRRKAGPGAVAAARAELRLPCLLTTLTTAGGLAALAVQEESQLIRSFGIWAAVGTLLAYGLTFSVGRALLPLSLTRRPAPRWPARFAWSVMRISQRRAGTVLATWAGLLVAAVVGLTHLEVAVRFPKVFAPGHPFARELSAMDEMLGIDLSPLEIYVEATDTHGRRSVPLASAMMSVTYYLQTLPESRVVLPHDLLDPETFQAALAPAMRVDRADRLEVQLTELAKDPRLAPWVRFDRGAGRVQVQFAPMSFERRREIDTWLRHFGETMLSHHRLSFGGSGYHYLLAERRGVDGAAIGGYFSLLVVAGALAWSFRRPRLIAVALVGNLAPLVLIAGFMGAIGLPWSLAVLPLPAVLLGLAVDDTVHLLWPLRGGRRLDRGALRSGPALLATTAVLACSVGTLMLSGLQINRELGLLLPAGLLLALACDLSLLPALLTMPRPRRR
ncbi:MAG: RND transporter family protein [Planctomycetota bacterium]|jgi:predicted RND superfamily exporter protein